MTSEKNSGVVAVKKVKVNDISSREMMAIIFGSATGIGILSLPNSLVNEGGAQDSWISVLLSGIYPLYMVTMCVLMQKKHPDESILVLSKKYFGVIFGNILNVIYISNFLFLGTAVVSGLKNVIFTFIVSFSTPIKIIIVITTVSLMSACKGLKVLGRINEIFLYLTLLLVSVTLAAYTRGTIINILPIGGAGIKNIVSATKGAIFAYTGVEILFLIYPRVTDKANIKKSAYISAVIIILMYTWVVFSTIYFMGIDIIPKSIWSFLAVTKAVDVPVITNFRFIFMVLWSMIIFKTAANDFFALSYGINYFLNLKNLRNICIFLFPVIIILSYLYKNPVLRDTIVDKLTSIYTIFIVIYVTLIVIISYSKRDENKCA